MTNPILETNIEKICEEHLPNEVELLREKISEHYKTIDMLRDRLHRLLKVADVLDINLPHDEPRDPTE